MKKVNDLLSQRLQKAPVEQSKKMSALAKQTANGQRNSFSSLFSSSELSSIELSFLEKLLQEHSLDSKNIHKDLSTLVSLNKEIKSIGHQAALLHGERILKARSLLKSYKEGAFSKWLLGTYGNRQSPYNFLQYYEFWQSISQPLRQKVESMPRQIIYTLASRSIAQKEKEGFIKEYKNEGKALTLKKIRQRFPLEEKDKRKTKESDLLLKNLQTLEKKWTSQTFRFNTSQKQEIQRIIKHFQKLLATL